MFLMYFFIIFQYFFGVILFIFAYNFQNETTRSVLSDFVILKTWGRIIFRLVWYWFFMTPSIATKFQYKATYCTALHNLDAEII
jgi:hypothetical protein